LVFCGGCGKILEKSDNSLFLDDISLSINDGDSLIENGSFTNGLNHWIRKDDFYNNASVHGQHLLKNKILESYYIIDLTETVFYELSHKYTVEYKSCSNSEWTIYGTGFTYFDFSLKIPESELPQYECFDFRVTIDNTQALSENRVYPYINPSNTPTPTATVTPFLTPTSTPLPSQTPSSTPLPTPTPSVTPSQFFGDSNWPEVQPGQSKWFVPCDDSLTPEIFQGINWQFFVSYGPTLSSIYSPKYYYSDTLSSSHNLHYLFL